MKNAILTITAVAISAIAHAQTDSTNRMNNDLNNNKSGHDMNSGSNQNQNNHTMNNSSSDGYRLQNGKVMMSKNGQMTAMDKEMTFSDGSRLRSDGTIMRKDGSRLIIKDGEYVDLTGKLVKSDKNKDMYLVPDSSKNTK